MSSPTEAASATHPSRDPGRPLASASDEPAPPAAPQSRAIGWRFPAAFWTANIIEAAERAAYYGWFIMLAPFLTGIVGYSDIQAGYIGGCFAALLYLLPFVSGAVADRIGYRPALLIALALLGSGYLSLGLWPQKHLVLGSMLLIMLGGALVKPIITGTVARSSDEAHRARAFSLFYMMVNLGSFCGKTIAKPVRVSYGLATMPILSAAAIGVALLVVALLYFPKSTTATADGASPPPSTRSITEALKQLQHDFLQVLKAGRLMALVLITSGFWIIQSQMYASMPKYVLRTVGAHASPEWYANVNPVMVVLCVVPITYLGRKLKPVTSMAIALGLIPLSALGIAFLPQLLGAVGPMHPVTFAMLAGIALQGCSECFLSPRYFEYASRLAPSGKEALYMGYAHLNNFFSWLIGYILSGYLLEAFCPDPAKLSAPAHAEYATALRTATPLPAAYAHAHYLWLVFAGIGVVAFFSLLVFQQVVRRSTAAKSA